MKSVQWDRRSSMPTDRRTDRRTDMTKLIAAFCNFSNGLKIRHQGTNDHITCSLLARWRRCKVVGGKVRQACHKAFSICPFQWFVYWLKLSKYSLKSRRLTNSRDAAWAFRVEPSSDHALPTAGTYTVTVGTHRNRQTKKKLT